MGGEWRNRTTARRKVIWGGGEEERGSEVFKYTGVPINIQRCT